MCRDLTEVRPSPPPPGTHSLRWYRPGDETTWLAIQTSTGIYDSVSPDLFRREFDDNAEMLGSRQCYLDDSHGRSVGTATAWVAGEGRQSSEGRVHWVAVVPECQRRGLGRYLTGVVCDRLRELGAERAYLTTGSRNLAAVQLYLGWGFRPEVNSKRGMAAWGELAARLNPGFRQLLEGFIA